jgi:UDP-N-acetylmuramoyl-tripeptide--D-alanyl-D-alanine ligase
MSDVTLGNTWVTWGSTGGVLSFQGEDIECEIPRTGLEELERVQQAVADSVSAGQPFPDAVKHHTQLVPTPHVFDVIKLLSDIILIDDTQTVVANDAVSSLKRVTNVAARQSRVIVVAGAFEFDQNSDYDSLEAFGALMVRLNIDQVFAVGPEARALFLSVGREGSWDGESQHCVDIRSAYDELRAFIRPGDVVLVMGSHSVDLQPLVTQLRESYS